MNKRVLSLAVPSILANITVPLVGMVDVGVSGRLGDAVAIGAMAISTMLFDLLYWNLGFLRVGTGGMVAQAFGRRDFKDVMKIFTQGLGTALSIALLIFALQYFFTESRCSLIDNKDLWFKVSCLNDLYKLSVLKIVIVDKVSRFDIVKSV